MATIQRGRSDHLRRQAAGVARQTRPAERYVVVSMDVEGPPPGDFETVHLPVPDGVPLPLAAARNRALDELRDVDLAILLDVDCIPADELVAHYVAADGDALLAGPVGRLRRALPDDRDRPTPEELDAARGDAGGRPVPAPGAVTDEPRVELFWSLSFAVRPAVHARIGGFDEAYAGYGAEDTDYGFRARAAGVTLRWVGGAWAYHQHHPVSHPPREHLEDIVVNARRFRAVWGRWPMEGWLRSFAASGLVEWEPEGERLELLALAA